MRAFKIWRCGSGNNNLKLFQLKGTTKKKTQKTCLELSTAEADIKNSLAKKILTLKP
jgi:hypothetical protein